MGKGNIVYHNLRMNLDNEQHRRVHSVLAELNTDVHKSVNQFLIDAADSYISRLAGNELTKDFLFPEAEISAVILSHNHMIIEWYSQKAGQL